ncbi:MAG TPA: hypothetical protein PK530_17360 [Anaerolineales bacterium]|nr:hypothetical protein [Anaerolineales bacterium]
MKETKKKPTPQTFTLELPTIGELRLEKEGESDSQPLQLPKKEPLNEDLIHRLINCVKKI